MPLKAVLDLHLLTQERRHAHAAACNAALFRSKNVEMYLNRAECVCLTLHGYAIQSGPMLHPALSDSFIDLY